MKRRILATILAATMMISLAACGAKQEAPAEEPAAEAEEETKEEEPAAEAAEVPETAEIHWGRANSGNILVTIAQQQGYFDEYGLTVVEDPVESSAAALTALQTEQLDVTSNQGTNNPLQFIAEGSDFTIVGGYMLKGMYVVGLKDTEYTGVESLKGCKFAYAGIHPVIGMAMLDAGLDPMDENTIEWLTYSTNSDRLAAVIAGEADFAILSGDQLFAVGNNDQIEIKAWVNDLVPNYGCCRMNMNTKFVDANPTTVKLLLKALIRAEQWYNANKEECVKILAEQIGAEEDYVAAYLLNPEYVSSVDPCRNSVIKTWEGMIAEGFVDEATAGSINIEDHINVELYKEALDECVAEHGAEDPEFYDGRVAFFEENNK